MESDNGNINRRVLAGFAWQGATKFLVQALSWVSTILVARLLEPSDYGIMAVANVFLMFMLMFTDMGLAQALMQRSQVNEADEDAVFWLSLLVGGVLYAILFLLAPVIAAFYQMPDLTWLMRLGALGIVISSLKTVPSAILMRRLDFRSRALIEVWASLASIVTVVGLALAGFGVWSLMWAALAQQVIITLAYMPIMGRWPRPVFDFGPILGIVRYGMHLMGANIAFVVSSKADVFIIGKFLGGHFTGIYSLAFQLATIPLDKIGTLFNHVAFPSLARLKEDEQQCRTLFVELHRYLLFIAYPVLIGIAAVADDLVALLLGAKWHQVTPILQVLCVVNIVRVSGMLISPALNSRGREREALRYSLAGAVLLPLAFLLGVQFGLEGVAVAWMVGYPLLYWMLLRYLHQDLGVTLTELISQSRPTLMATTVMAAAVLTAQALLAGFPPAVRLGAAVTVGMVAYVGVFLIFYGEQVARMRQALRELRGGSAA
jgi:O-antigen/teichoic acid export membrane protein